LQVTCAIVRAKLHQAKCSSSRVINNALDFGQPWTLIVNISGMDQAIDKRNYDFFAWLMKTIRWTLAHKRKNDLRPWYSIEFVWLSRLSRKIASS